MIEIFNTVIDEKEVIGVGPLFIKRPADQTIALMYNERQFYFEVYTTKYHFTITTDWLSGKEPHIENSKLIQSQLYEAYRRLRHCLIVGDFDGMIIYTDETTLPDMPT